MDLERTSFAGFSNFWAMMTIKTLRLLIGVSSMLVAGVAGVGVVRARGHNLTGSRIMWFRPGERLVGGWCWHVCDGD